MNIALYSSSFFCIQTSSGFAPHFVQGFLRVSLPWLMMAMWQLATEHIHDRTFDQFSNFFVCVCVTWSTHTLLHSTECKLSDWPHTFRFLRCVPGTWIRHPHWSHAGIFLDRFKIYIITTTKQQQLSLIWTSRKYNNIIMVWLTGPPFWLGAAFCLGPDSDAARLSFSESFSNVRL